MSLFYNRDHAVLEALNTSQAIIEFDPDGKILSANDNFLKVVGYSLSDIVGKHHRIFCDATYVEGADYRAFWRDLDNGTFRSDEFKRFTRSGDPVWLQASYNPVRGRNGQIARIVKIATDITAAKQKSLDDSGKINAIYLSQAVIEFLPDGTILTANDNFLKAMGYGLDEIRGQHHRMFCEPAFVQSTEYRTLWSRLAQGQFVASEYKRIGKGGREVYIQAAYNPIFDDTGKVVKVVKFAVDMSDMVKKRMRNDGIGNDINDALGKVLDQIDNANILAKGASGASTATGSIINSVAAASEELTLSVREISHNMGSAHTSVENVVKYAETANQSASGLNDSAASMTNVVTIIQDIASQINLLALNATIESARAGDAGKGFAVVASEVKNLANQAASSTKTIAAEITNMQAVSTGVVEALGLISSHMASVMQNVSSVAEAIDQQNTVTSEISANMQSAVLAVQEIESSLGQITTTFSTVVDASEQVKHQVETLVA